MPKCCHRKIVSATDDLSNHMLKYKKSIRLHTHNLQEAQKKKIFIQKPLLIWLKNCPLIALLSLDNLTLLKIAKQIPPPN